MPATRSWKSSRSTSPKFSPSTPAPSCSIPEWGLPAAKRRAKGSGLLLAYEKTGYDKQLPGRLPDLLDLWSAKRLKEAGADCVKILLYYSPFDDPKINDLKHAWTERIGDECRSNDIPFFLELVGYKEGIDEKSVLSSPS